METMQVIEKVKSAQPTTGKKDLVINKIAPGQWVRQGDIYVKRLPDGVFPREASSFSGPEVTIANGHVAIGRFSVIFSGWEAEKHLKAMIGENKEHRLDWGYWLFKADGTWKIPHEEHACLVMPPGEYVAWSQIETDPNTGKDRQVAD